MKRLLGLLLIGLCLFGRAVAQENDRVYVINDFSKGLNSHISDLNTPANQANEALNVRFNDRYGALSKRELLVGYGNTTSGAAITGLHRFYKSDGTVKLIASSGTKLYVGDDDTGNFTVIKQSLTDGKRWNFVTYQDIAIGMNGYDNPIKYDGLTTITANTTGARTANNTVTELGAPFVQLNTGTELNASSWYQYKIAYWDGATYDYSTAKSNPILTGADVYATKLTDIPLGPTGTTCRYIYRTLGNVNQTAVEADTVYYMVMNISNNTATTWNDTISDATADDNSTPTWATVSAGSNVTPPMGSILAIQSERLFVSGNNTYPSDVYFSCQYSPDHFTPTDFIQVRPDDGDKVTFIKTHLGILNIGKTNSIQKLYTEGSTSNWLLGDPFSFIGCPAPYTVSVSPMGIIYLGRNGLYIFDGQSSSLISDAVTPDINDISQTNIGEAAGYYWNNQYRLAYTSEKSGEAIDNRVLLYDLTRDAYTIDTEYVNCFTSFGSGSDFGTLYSGSSSTDGYIFAHTGSANLLSKRYKSEFDAGTFDDMRTYNTEDNPLLEISWDCTIDGWLTEFQTKDANVTKLDDTTFDGLVSIIDRPDTGGVWTSPVYDINAQSLDKLYWNEQLGMYGDVTWQIHLGAATSDCLNATWSSTYTNPSGSDISNVTGNRYMQLRCNLTTTDIDYSPTLYLTDNFVFKVAYSKIGANYETSTLSLWRSGWTDFGIPGYRKLIKRIKVFYEGTAGTLNFNYKNDDGDVDKTFSIDLSVEPGYSSSDLYTGDNINKIYTYYTPANSPTEPSAIGQLWQFLITEDGSKNWKISKIEVLYEP